jgi:hypothetical protein
MDDMMDREKFVELQASVIDQKFALTSGEETSRERFCQLAIDTYDFLMSMGATFVHAFDPWPESGGNALRIPWWGKRNDSARIELAPDLMGRWKSWNDEYFEVLGRNPRLELRNMMQQISESHRASSWPDGYERRIQDWVDTGDPSAPPPFDDRYGIITPEFFSRLCTLRRLCSGWLYWDNNLNRIVFASETEWQPVRAKQELAEAKAHSARQESHAKWQRYAIRLQDVMLMARSDTVFWQALRVWELEREGSRPSELPSARPLAGPIVLRSMSLEERTKLENPPVDPIFAAFIARVREPDDVLTARDIVLNLRGEMRREIGLDNTLGWPGGPGLGAA